MNNQITLFDRDSDYLESSVKDFDNSTASFRVHASLIYKLGESLIADEITALSELIKNAYDADATICTLSINSEYSEKINGRECKGYIELSDNGCGMDLNTIVNGWLTLSNSPKKKMKKEQKTTPKYHRYPLGDKGLGRLSVQKLGRYMQMTTKSADSNVEYCVIIPWGDFLKNTTIDQIPVTIRKQESTSKKSYTKIIIKDLINPEMWGRSEQINLLTNSINKIVSPFRSKESSFRVVAQINNQPVDIENKVFDELLSSARAKHTIKYNSGNASILSEFKNSFFYNRDVLSKITSGEFTLSETAVKDFLQTYKKDFPNVSTCFHEGVSLVFKDNCIFPDVVAPISPDKSDSNIVKKSVAIDPGAFECEIYEYSLDQKLLDYLYDNISYSNLIKREEYRDFISRYHGIKVVRDGFLIQGFGEGDGGDWLGLSSSSKTTGYFFDLRIGPANGINEDEIEEEFDKVLAEHCSPNTFSFIYYINKQRLQTKNNDKIAKSLAQGFKRKACFELFQLFNDCLSDGLSETSTRVQKIRQKTLNYLFTNKVSAKGEPYIEVAARLVEIFHQDEYNRAIAGRHSLIAEKARYYEKLCSAITEPIGNEKQLTSTLKEYRAIELYNEHVNQQHCEIATGDIFEIGSSYFLLVSQSCDTCLRSDGHRKLKFASLLEIQDNKETKYSYKLSCFLNMKKPVVLYHSLKTIPFEVLDLCVFNTNGQSSIVLNDLANFEKDLESYTQNYRLRFREVLEFVKTIQFNKKRLESFFAGEAGISAEDAKIAYNYLEDLDPNIKNFDTVEIAISFPVRRVARLRELIAIDIVKEYGIALSRIGHPFDFTGDDTGLE